MNGIELSKRFFEEYGLPMLQKDFSEIINLLAVGFVGSGSDKYGFDDEISTDHDFEPGFCIFLPSEEVLDRRTAFLLERAYAKLPKEFMGIKRQPLSPVGGNRNGVIRINDFYSRQIGSENGELSTKDWLTVPDYALFEATNGEVFFDNFGLFSEIRENLKNMPYDIKLKRIAGNLLLMGQSGPYNFSRCLSHKEPLAAQLALNEFVISTLKVTFLLFDKYMPYYKWSFRALSGILGAENIYNNLSLLLIGDNSNIKTSKEKSKAIEDISAEIISILKEKYEISLDSVDLERFAYSLNDKIKDGEIRNLNIFAGI